MSVPMEAAQVDLQPHWRTSGSCRDENLLENSRSVGGYLLDRLREFSDHPAVGDVRGVGLFAGVELVADKKTRAPVGEDVMQAVMRRISAERVLIGRTNRSIPGLNNTLNIAPALIATRADIDTIVDAVGAGLQEAS